MQISHVYISLHQAMCFLCVALCLMYTKGECLKVYISKRSCLADLGFEDKVEELFINSLVHMPNGTDTLSVPYFVS